MSLGTFLGGATAKPHRVLVLGGAYAGLGLVSNLLRQTLGLGPDGLPASAAVLARRPVEITILDERDGFYHTIGSPLAFASEAYGPKAWRVFDDIPKIQHPAVSVLRGRVTAIDCEKRIATYTSSESASTKTQAYDYLAVCTGLRRNWPVVPIELTKAKYLTETGNFIKGIKESSDGVIVIGAGAVGVEVAAELKMAYPDTTIRLVHAHDKLLSAEPLPDDYKDRVKSVLLDLGVDLVLDERVAEVKINPSTKDGQETYTVHLQSGREFQAGKVINSVSRGVPNTDFLPASTLSPEKYVNIRPTFQFAAGSPNADYHFAAGDLANWSGIKRVGMAMHMGATTATNIYRHILASEQTIDQSSAKLEEYPHVPAMLALACGKVAVKYHPDTGITCGQDIKMNYFGYDLGFTKCWNRMELGEKFEVEKTIASRE